MLKKIVKFFSLFSPIVENRKKLLLVDITYGKHGCVCEFHDSFNLNGRTISVPIKEVITNIKYRSMIDSCSLIKIGVEYQKYFNEDTLCLDKVDLVNNIVYLSGEKKKIRVDVSSLMKDIEMLEKIKKIDLIRILCPYVYVRGYNTVSFLDENYVSDATHVNSNNSTIDNFSMSKLRIVK